MPAGVASFAPYSRESLLIADHALQAGATLIALTDSSASPLALQTHATLQFEVQSPSFFPSVAAGVALTEALLTAAAGLVGAVPALRAAAMAWLG